MKFKEYSMEGFGDFLLFNGKLNEIIEEMNDKNLKGLSSPHMAFFIYNLKNDNKTAKKMIRLLENGWFVEFTGHLYLPKTNKYMDRIIFEDNPVIKNKELIMDKSDLIKKSSNSKSNVRIVPFNFKKEEQVFGDLFNYVVTRYGGKGAEYLSEFSKSLKKTLKINIKDKFYDRKKGLSAIGNDPFLYDNNCLSIVGDFRLEDSCYAVAVKESIDTLLQLKNLLD